jgi:hypothetical protein
MFVREFRTGALSHSAVRSRRRGKAIELSPRSSPGWDSESIARVDDSTLKCLAPSELIDFVRSGAGGLRWFIDEGRLEWMDADDLRRLAFLVRRGCQQSVNAVGPERTYEPFWVEFLD